MSSSICPHFTQNAWRKDLCSNCFKSKDEHKQASGSSSRSPFSFGSSKKHAAAAASLAAASSRTEADHKKTDFPNKHKTPAKSIIKKKSTATTTTTKSSKGSSSKAHKVSFPKNISEVIGYGGEWSDNDNDHDDDQYSDDDDDHDFMNLANERHQDDLAAASTDDEEALELKRITRANTDFNMNNGNLLGDPQENIKKSFAALKLGAPQVDKEGKKQTLKINVMPFGAAKSAVASAGDSSKQAAASNKVKFEPKTEAKADTTAKSTTKSGQVSGSTAAKKPSAGSAAIVSKASSLSSSSLSTSSLSTSSLSTSSASSLKAIADRTSDNDGTSSPPIERAMEKSLLDEISETLELKQNESKKLSAEKEAASVGSSSASASASKIKFEITSLTETLESKSSFLDLKKPIARNPPITKDHAKPKINVFHKYTTSDTDSNCSDTENGVSAYYDVVETQLSYENLPDGKCQPAERQQLQQQQQQQQVVAMSTETPNNASGSGSGSDSSGDSKSIFSSSQYITDMLLSSKTRAASYNLHEGNFMTSKITSDGLIVTKCSSDDALDSTGSSFDGSSEDEETSYNMIRSESDSGIGISISGNDYKNLGHHGQNLKLMEKERERQRVEKKLSASTNNSDYEDIQVADHQATSAPTTEGAKASPSPSATATNSTNSNAGSSSVSTSNLRPASSTFSLEKSRELHGEPDGSADPDGSLENNQTTMSSTPTSLPALPKSPPPTKTIDARPSFLHGLQKHHPPLLLKKPDLPAKPVVVSPVASPLKTFQASAKRQPTNVEQQVISQLQLVMSKSNENLAAGAVVDAAKDEAKLKQQLKGRAPNPPPTASSEPRSSAPPTPERDYNVVVEFAEHERQEQGEQQPKPTEVEDERKKPEATKTTSVTPAPPAATSVGAASAAGPSSIYTRKLPTLAVVGAGSGSGGAKNTASPVIREKDKRERATINPKFRSLNTFVTQRSNAAKNLQLQAATSSLSLKQPLTPEPTPRNPRNLSLSEECLAEVAATRATTTGSGHQSVSASSFDLSATPSSADKKPPSPQKTKSKFSIKKFLRMGASKTTDNLHKKDGVYSEICTGEDSGVVGKPRLVIIHPIDINPTAVEVVKDITKTGDAVAAQTVAVVTSKPPAPPLRSMDGQRPHELNKPARPPPPKSAELRRKQRGSNGTGAESGTGAGHATGNGPSSMGPELATPGSIKCKADNVYANLGEIRSSIAPRKPERTASMREREAQLELVRKRHHSGQSNDNTVDTVSICSSNGENVLAEQQQHHQQTAANILSSTASTLSPQLSVGGRGGGGGGGSSAVDGKPPSGSRTSTFERKKSDPKIASKLEIFESRSATAPINNNSNNNNTTNGSLKDSVRKINSTIDSYLKDKRDFENMYEFVKSPSSPSSPPPPPARSVDLGTAQRGNLPLPLPLPPATPRRGGLYSDTASVASYTRSEYGPARSYGLGFNGSLANIPRVISASYCGSEAGEFDIYSPYSYYGSEAGGDVATDINDSVWGIPSVIKNRAKATNRLRMRKGRSVVHKTIEDNYTAVVVANHEALAQVLDQLQQTPIIPPALRPLANAINLRFEDFTILDGAQAFVVGKKAFHAALWTTAPVTLALSADCNQLSGVGGELNQLSGGVSGVLNPITEFCDLVPSYHLPLMPSTEVTLLQATISVLPRLQLDTLQSIGGILKGKSQVLDKSNFNFRGSIPNLTAGLGLGSGTSSTSGLKDGGPVGSSALRNVMSVQNLTTLNEGESMDKEGDGEASASAASGTGNMPAFDDVMTREVAFIMLQLVNGMKNLQAKAIEEMPLSLSNVVLSKDAENKDAQARLCVLQGNNNDEDEPMGTLCKCAHIALTELLPTTKITPILADILLQERSESLSKSKSVLEFVLWGPSDVVLSGSTKERELALQRWLDLERATVLHGLVRTRVELTVYDECHLMFLVRSNAKMMNDAAKIVCHYQQQQQQHPHESRD